MNYKKLRKFSKTDKKTYIDPSKYAVGSQEIMERIMIINECFRVGITTQELIQLMHLSERTIYRFYYGYYDQPLFHQKGYMKIYLGARCKLTEDYFKDKEKIHDGNEYYNFLKKKK